MSDIIKIKGEECFIDSEGLACLSNLETRAVNQLIKRKKAHLEEFGSLSLSVINQGEAKGGRPKHIYYLNEQQATLLTTFMQNSDIVMEFKKKLVREFFKMREHIKKQQITRAVGIETRKSLTDSIKDSGENERMHGKGYSNYTRMVYEVCNLKERYKLFKKLSFDEPLQFREWITTEELKRVEQAEALIKPMLELERQYDDIKKALKPLFERKELK